MTTSSKPKRVVFLAMLAAIAGNSIWGVSSMFSKVGLHASSPAILLAWRFCISLAGMTVYAAVKGIRLGVPKKALCLLPLLGLFQPILNFTLEQYGILYSSAAFCGVMQAMSPIAGLILGFLMLGEKPTIWQVLFSCLSITGVLILTITCDGTGIVTMAGAVLLLSAVVFATVYFMLSRKLAGVFTTFQRTYYMTATGAVVFPIWALAENRQAPMAVIAPAGQPEFLVSVLFLGLISTMAAYMCLNYATANLPAARFTAFTGMTTLTAVLSGVLILGEPFLPIMIPTTIMIIVGTWGVQKFTPEAMEAKKTKP